MVRSHKRTLTQTINSATRQLGLGACVAFSLAGCVTIPQVTLNKPVAAVSVASLATNNQELIRARWGAYTDLMGNNWWGTGGGNGYGAQMKWTVPGAEAVGIMTVNSERTPLKIQYNPEKRALDIFNTDADNKLIREAVVKPDGSVVWTAEMLGLVGERRIAYDAAQGMLLDTDGIRVVMKPVTAEAFDVAYKERVEIQRQADLKSEARKEAFWDGVVEVIAGVGDVIVGAGEVLGSVIEGVAMAAPAVQQSYSQQQTYPNYQAQPYRPPQPAPQRIAPTPAPAPQQYRPAASPVAPAQTLSRSAPVAATPSPSTSRTVPPKAAPMQMAKGPQINLPAPMMTPNVPPRRDAPTPPSNPAGAARVGVPCPDWQPNAMNECTPNAKLQCKSGETRVNGKCERNQPVGGLTPTKTGNPQPPGASTYDDPNTCVSQPSSAKQTACGGKGTAVKIVNGCAQTVDVRLCIMDTNGKWDCGVKYGIKPGESMSNWSCNGTGQFFRSAVTSRTNQKLAQP